VLLGVDVGGTFTDAALVADGVLHTAKAPTTPDDQSQGVLDAVHAALALAAAEPAAVERFVHGMTVGTNALLEEKVARTALLATEGFTDLEELGRQARAELYRLCAGHPPPLVPPELRVAVPERCGPDGVVRPLDRDELRRRIEAAGEFDAAAVCLLWGFRHPEHESACADALGAGVHVSLSHETAGVFREYERCATTVVDAALSPLLRRYLERLAERATDAGLPVPEVMLSGGGVAPAAVAARHGSWTVLSGPAGGAVGAARAAADAGAPDAVCLDMGGTSCDVSVALGGRARASGGREVGGRALALPMVDVHTVGAGGGSIAWRDAGGALRVGPRSAGAVPGPACYARGGEEPTVTDANLLLGHLDADAPLAGGVTLDRDAAERALERLAADLGEDVHATAKGIVRVASAEMAAAVRVMTVERGIDPRELALLAFGGAGPLHAAAVADELAIRRVVVPRASGVLSAVGLVVSERRSDAVESVLLAGDELTADAVGAVVERLADRSRAALGTGGGEVRPSYDLRYAGQAFELTIDGAPRPDPSDLRAAFARAHEERYGYADPDAQVELVTVRVAVALPGGDAGREREVEPGAVDGPARIDLAEATLVIPDGWSGRVDAAGTWTVERRG
jgi:N-methylhydantoinase A